MTFSFKKLILQFVPAALRSPTLQAKPVVSMPTQPAPPPLPTLRKAHLIKRPRRCIGVGTAAVVFINGSTTAEPCTIINVSDNGLQIKLDQPHCQELLGKSILIAFEHEKEWMTCQAAIRWLESQKRLGCQLEGNSYSWKKFVARAWKNAEHEPNKIAS